MGGMWLIAVVGLIVSVIAIVGGIEIVWLVGKCIWNKIKGW